MSAIFWESVLTIYRRKEAETEVPEKILEMYRACPEEKQYLLLEIMEAISKLYDKRQ